MRALSAYSISVALLFAAWLVSFGLSLDDALRNTALSPIVVAPAEGPDEYPTVVEIEAGSRAMNPGLAPGDRLLALGGTDLRGAASPTWVSVLARFHGPHAEVPIAIERGGERQTLTMRAASHSRWWPRLVASLVFAACALVLLVRLRQSKLVRALVLSDISVAWLMASWFAGSLLETWASLASQMISVALVLPLTLRAFVLFPRGVAPTRGWAIWGPWGFATMALFDSSLFWALPFSRQVGAVGLGVIGTAYALILVTTLARSYRSSDAIGRRQLRWVVLGAYLAAIPAALAQWLSVISPGFAWLVALSLSGVAVLPLCTLIAITRYNFLDVDRVLTSTASISVLLVVVLALLTSVAPTASDFVSSRLDVHTATAHLFLAGLLVLPLTLAHHRLRRGIERVFVAERYRLEKGIAVLGERISACGTPQELIRCAGDGVYDLLAPNSCSIYMRVEDSVAPVFFRGGLDPPRFTVDSLLVAALAQQQVPLALEEVRAGAGFARVGPFQRAAIDSLGVPVVVPVRYEKDLVAFLCLGEKRSGDLYANGDLSLLTVVAEELAGGLERFEQRQILETSQTLNERMRPYLDKSLAEHLERGESLDVGERAVSVLFVDIRGYTAYVENLEADQLLATVNQYADAASKLIAGHGGTVVSFSGDGIMAVFGAPDPLEQMEQAAVAAGREIVECVPQLASSAGPLRLGAGVATGPACVSNVHAGDRLHWTALGNTTNLASRLQELTRQLDAVMIIDEATWSGCGDEAQNFQRHSEMPIRGLARSVVVYLMPPPLPPAESA